MKAAPKLAGRKLVKPPHYCNSCNDQLYRVEVVNIKTRADCGHYWRCADCNLNFIGYGDPHEYPNDPSRKPDYPKKKTAPAKKPKRKSP